LVISGARIASPFAIASVSVAAALVVSGVTVTAALPITGTVCASLFAITFARTRLAVTLRILNPIGFRIFSLRLSIIFSV